MKDIEFTTSANVHLLSDADKQKLQEMAEVFRQRLEQQN